MRRGKKREIKEWDIRKRERKQEEKELRSI